MSDDVHRLSIHTVDRKSITRLVYSCVLYFCGDKYHIVSNANSDISLTLETLLLAVTAPFSSNKYVSVSNYNSSVRRYIKLVNKITGVNKMGHYVQKSLIIMQNSRIERLFFFATLYYISLART